MEINFWTKDDIMKVLDEHTLKGDRETRHEIMRTIKEQDSELAKLELQMIKFSFLVFGAVVTYLARSKTAYFLQAKFDQ
eukprot:403355872